MIYGVDPFDQRRVNYARPSFSIDLIVLDNYCILRITYPEFGRLWWIVAIGIVAKGPKAGEAIFNGLRMVERVSGNCIGGFAVYSVLTQDGKLVSYETQRGGTNTLVTEGEETGVLPSKEVLEAPIAGLISGGPDRPEPLSQFLPAKAGVGIVTGHRMPNALGVSGKPVNVEVLELMKAGMDAGAAVAKVMDANPEVDAGLLAIDVRGNIGWRNSPRVDRSILTARHSRRESASGVVEVLLNEIFPPETAELAAAVGIGVMTGKEKADAYMTISSGVPVEYGPEDMIYVDENLVVEKVYTPDRTLLKGRRAGIVPYMSSKVVQNGKVIGRLTLEALTVLEDGVIKELDGQTSVKLSLKKAR